MNKQIHSFWEEIDRFTHEAEENGLIRPPTMGRPRKPANPSEITEFVTTRRMTIESKADAAAMSLSDVNRRRDLRFYALVALSVIFIVIMLTIVYLLRNTQQLGGGVLAIYVSVLTGFIMLEKSAGSNDLEALRLESVGVILPYLDEECFLKVARELHYHAKEGSRTKERAPKRRPRVADPPPAST
jgi:hypothetical protein